MVACVLHSPSLCPVPCQPLSRPCNNRTTNSATPTLNKPCLIHLGRSLGSVDCHVIHMFILNCRRPCSRRTITNSHGVKQSIKPHGTSHVSLIRDALKTTGITGGSPPEQTPGQLQCKLSQPAARDQRSGVGLLNQPHVRDTDAHQKRPKIASHS